MTKIDIIKENFPEIENKIDYALPQNWLNYVIEITDENYDIVRSNFVWLYDDNDYFGSPFPITKTGKDILNKYNQLTN